MISMTIVKATYSGESVSRKLMTDVDGDAKVADLDASKIFEEKITENVLVIMKCRKPYVYAQF